VVLDHSLFQGCKICGVIKIVMPAVHVDVTVEGFVNIPGNNQVEEINGYFLLGLDAASIGHICCSSS
jgi:hypothetical protein